MSADLLELRGAPPPTASEALPLKVSRLHTAAFERYSQPPVRMVVQVRNMPAVGLQNSEVDTSGHFDLLHVSHHASDKLVTLLAALKDADSQSEGLCESFKYWRNASVHTGFDDQLRQALRDNLAKLSASYFEWTSRVSHYSDVLTEQVSLLSEVSSGSRARLASEAWETVYHALAEQSFVDVEPEWSDELNDRRCDLVDKKIDHGLSPEEATELERLQTRMLAYRRKVAPRPLEEARKVHQQLLKEAAEHDD